MSLLGIIASQASSISGASPGSQSLTASLFVDGDTFYAPTVTLGAVTLTPSLFTDTDTFYTHVVSGGAWTPAALGAALRAHYDFSLLTGSNGDPQGSVTDQSGNGFNLSQSGGTRPTLAAANQNSLNTLRFTAASAQRYNLSSSIFSGASAASAYIVYKVVSVAANNGLWNIGAVGNDAFPFSNGLYYEDFASTARKDGMTATASSATAYRIISLYSAASDWAFYMDGGTGGSSGGTSPVHQTGTNTVGFAGSQQILGTNGSLVGLDGWVAEVFFTNAKQSTGNRQKAEGYLAHKWGLTGNLDASHPYKTNPPDGEAIGQTLLPSLFTDTDTFFAPTVTGGVVTLLPSLFTDADTFFAPVVSGGGGGSYEDGVVAIGAEALWDDRENWVPAGAPNKILGVDDADLPPQASFSGGFLVITGSCTIGSSSERWDFSAATSVEVNGNSTVVTFNHVLFDTGTYSNPAVGSTKFYGLQISGNGTHPTVTLNNCKFDGNRYQSNSGVAGPWSGAAIYVLTGSSITINDTTITGCGYDPIKVTNASITVRNLLIEAYGWNVNADADGLQGISAVVDYDGFIIDISDGGLVEYGSVFPGIPPNSAFFMTIDTPSTQNSTGSIKNGIFKGFNGYGTSQGVPYNVLSVADNHTATGNGFHVVGIDWENLAIEKGNSGSGAPSTSGYVTWGGTETDVVSVGTWTNIVDLQSATAISRPSF